MAIILGCVADDFTGATDLANTLVRNGMRTVQLLGVPDSDSSIDDVDAVVIALKSRTAPVDEAIRDSLQSLRWLQAAGASQFFFKYCSTFDSTPAGNIGPVAEALMADLGESFTIACPAFPENQRSICHGYLFVGDVLLSESGMQNHPLTPMTDSNLVRVLDQQTQGEVGLADYTTVNQGPEALTGRFRELQQEGKSFAIVDALSDEHLITIGTACADMKLITGGSGVALGLPENYRQSGLLEQDVESESLPSVDGLAVVLSGSCSDATNTQVEEYSRKHPSFFLEPARVAEEDGIVIEAIEWVKSHLHDGAPLMYSTAAPEVVAAAQSRYGREALGEKLEQAFASIAAELLESGVRKLVIAGGETSGAVVQVLGVTGLRIGPQIDPGVPWTVSIGEPRLALTLKSGNFGTNDFFEKALRSAP